jgi:hypothetical protein
MPYPDTNLGQDLEDDDYGGQPAADFGEPAFTWLNSVLRFLGRAYLAYLRVPYTTVVAVSQSAAVSGDVAVFAPAQYAPGGAPYIAKASPALTGARCYGVYLEPCSAFALARIAVFGILPTTVTALAVPDAPQSIGVDAANGRLRVAQVGDVVVGTQDIQGNLFLAPTGQAL